MGRGRNAIYLASIGWDVTGYDMSKEALRAGEESAAAAGVKLTTKEAKHDSFDFGADRWDLIVCSYNGIDPHDKQWPPVFLRALRRGGIAVFQGTYGGATGLVGGIRLSLPDLLENWKGFHVLRIEDVDPGVGIANIGVRYASMQPRQGSWITPSRRTGDLPFRHRWTRSRS